MFDEGDITPEDVRRTGMSVEELRRSIAGEGTLLRLEIRLAGGPIQPHPNDAGDLAYLRFVKLVQAGDVVNEQIRQFERNVKRGRVLKLQTTSHGGFLHDPEQLRIFVPAMRAFLQKP